MFNLEGKIMEWRKQMLAAGIQTPVPLEELENHLREEIEQQMQSGSNVQQAFEVAAHGIGQTDALKTEFAKAGESFYGRSRQLVFTLAGIPNYLLTMNMNTSNQNIEPRWATYCKSSAFLFPAVSLWVLAMTFVYPKFHQICLTAKVSFPAPLLSVITLANFLKNNFLLVCSVLVPVVGLLEWRASRWPRYRRAVLGTVALLLNALVLIWFLALVIMSILAADKLAGHAD